MKAHLTEEAETEDHHPAYNHDLPKLELRLNPWTVSKLQDVYQGA